jgi:hypothetical protein
LDPGPWPQEEEVQHGEAQQVAAQQHRAQWELDIVEKVRISTSQIHRRPP